MSLPNAKFADDAGRDPHAFLLHLLSNRVASGDFQLVVFSCPQDKDLPEVRIDVRPVILKTGRCLQFARRTKTQEFHANLAEAEARGELHKLAGGLYRELRIVTTETVWQAHLNRKGRWKISQTAVSQQESPSPAVDLPASVAAAGSLLPVVGTHNKSRQYLIPDGVPCPFLIQTDIMTVDGKVRARHYNKFRQINRYLEFIHDAIKRSDAADGSADDESHDDTNVAESKTRSLRIVDFGCGKSYLTFATHYLLTAILKRPCHITGLDRRQDVVATCRRIASELRLEGIDFQHGEIADYQADTAVDLAISLHACDTATDDALRQAVEWQSQIILAVPCCQHELASKLRRETLPLLTDHGIFRERFAAMATDAVRAAVLEAMGYDTKLMEFIDMEHTPKNVLIRAIRRPSSHSPQTRQRAISQLAAFRDQLNLPELKLEKMLLNTEPTA